MSQHLDSASEARLSALSRAPLDRWIALSADETKIVADGATFEEAALAAEKNGETDPLIIRTPEDWTPRAF